MRKRILIFLLATLFVLSGCSRQVVSVLSDNGETASEIISQSISSDASSDSSEASSYGSSSLPISSRAAKSTASSKASASVSSNGSGIVAAPTVAEEKDTPLPTPEVETTTTLVTQVQTTHTAITQSSYYGYARLNTVEKALYNRLNTAVQATTNLINLSGNNYTLGDVQKVLAYFVADFPQYFWLYKYEFSYVTSHNKITQLILFYTDGETIDSYDEKKIDKDSNGWTLVDREKIAEQRNTFNQQISAVLKTIPANGSSFEKEKKIHVTYDNDLLEGLNQSPSDSKWLCHSSFTAYGALTKGKAVCEGYAKLFQYLCYETGIPCIPVIGTSNQQNHMWNAVQIDGDWYHTDTTWDDTSYQSIDGLLFYHYFNLTDKQISEDHVIGIGGAYDSTYPPPDCSATKYNYRDNYYIQMDEKGQLSENAQQLLSACVSARESYLTIRLNGTIFDLSGKLNNVKKDLNQLLTQSESKASLSQIQLSGDGQYSFIRVIYK